MTQCLFLAKALYDNIAETPDELAFRRGDVLTVVEQDHAGLEGWWLCSIRGKRGIAPGNRLKIVSGMAPVEVPHSAAASANQGGMELYDQPNRSLQDYDVPPANRGSIDRSSGHVGSREVLNRSSGSRSASLGDDLYDTPPNSNRASADDAGGLYDTPPSSKRTSRERTPPHSNRSSSSSRESGSHLLGTSTGSNSSLHHQRSSSNLSLPSVGHHRSGSHCSDSYNATPPGSNRSSLERILSEHGPPIYDTLSPAVSVEQIDSTYDTPPSRTRTLSHANPSSMMSLHSAGSSESLLSNTSGVSSTQLSQAASLPDSARSSMDLPADTYDVPPSLHDVVKSRKQLSMDSGLGFYDSPVKSHPTPSSTRHSSDGLKTSQSSSSFDSKSPRLDTDIKRSRSLENALDDEYDVPRNNAPKVAPKKTSNTGNNSFTVLSNEPSGVYDVPPQVTRDSVISMRSDSSDENQRFSSSSMDDQHMSEMPWDELFLDVDSALEILVKRQQDINKATARLSGFISDSWRSRASLEKTLYDIKVSCSQVKNSLNEYVNFARGSVANALKHADKQLATRLNKLVAPLQSTLEFVKKSFTQLEEMKWQVSILAEPVDKTKADALGQIALVAQELMPDVKKVSSFIQSHRGEIFLNSTTVDAKKMDIAAKPPSGPMSIYSKPKNMQHRPLPAVPGSEKNNIPSMSLKSPSAALSPASPISVYDIKAELHKDDYVECDELPHAKDSFSTHKNIMEQCVQEYDYVQLDSKEDPVNESKGKDYSIPSECSESEDIKTPTNKLSNDNGKIEEALMNDVTSHMANISVLDADVDMIPVRDSGAGDLKVQGNNEPSAQSKNTSEQYLRTSEFNCDDSATPSPTSPESDLSTPVNIDSCDASNFMLLTDGRKTGESEPLDPNDRQVLAYYTDQINTHSTLLSNAIDAFISVVGSNQPPNVFISHGKFVIVSAHKLVYIGDSIHRNLISNTISTRIMHCANQLCDCLKASVTATKTAALQYPSVPAVQDMVNKVIAVSTAAQDLKYVITQCVNS